MTIWIDADACPADTRHIVYKAADRHGLNVALAANSPQRTPAGVAFHHVPEGSDQADDFIVEHCEAGDLIITADVPLAARVVEKGATALNPRGELYTEETVGEALSLRNFMEEMRFANLAAGGPPPRSAADNQHFGNALDKFLTRQARKRSG